MQDKLPWWRHQMETFSALLAICAGNSPVTGEFPAQRPVTRGFDDFFDRLNKRLSKQSWGWGFETLSRPLWRHCNANLTLPMNRYFRLYPASRHPPPHCQSQQNFDVWISLQCIRSLHPRKSPTVLRITVTSYERQEASDLKSLSTLTTRKRSKARIIGAF